MFARRPWGGSRARGQRWRRGRAGAGAGARTCRTRMASLMCGMDACWLGGRVRASERAGGTKKGQRQRQRARARPGSCGVGRASHLCGNALTTRGRARSARLCRPASVAHARMRWCLLMYSNLAGSRTVRRWVSAARSSCWRGSGSGSGGARGQARGTRRGEIGVGRRRRRMDGPGRLFRGGTGWWCYPGLQCAGAKKTRKEKVEKVEAAAEWRQEGAFRNQVPALAARASGCPSRRARASLGSRPAPTRVAGIGAGVQSSVPERAGGDAPCSLRLGRRPCASTSSCRLR